MLKIDPNRNFNAAKTTASLRMGGENLASGNGFDAAEGAEGEGGNDFATILDNLSTKKTQSAVKESNSDIEKETESKFDDKTVKVKEKSAEEKSEKQDSSVKGREDQAGAANLRHAAGEHLSAEAETSLPPARAILHIADMERIVASVRTHNFEGNNQVLITLKNSVFDGLQIKLTSDSNQRITAELIAANDKVKAQLDARGGELADLLRQRGVKLESLKTSVGAETSGGNSNRQQQSELPSAVSAKNTKSLNNVVSDEIGLNETANNYRI